MHDRSHAPDARHHEADATLHDTVGSSAEIINLDASNEQDQAALQDAADHAVSSLGGTHGIAAYLAGVHGLQASREQLFDALCDAIDRQDSVTRTAAENIPAKHAGNATEHEHEYDTDASS